MSNPTTLFRAKQVVMPEFSQSVTSFRLVKPKNTILVITKSMETYLFTYHDKKHWGLKTENA